MQLRKRPKMEEMLPGSALSPSGVGFSRAPPASPPHLAERLNLFIHGRVILVAPKKVPKGVMPCSISRTKSSR